MMTQCRFRKGDAITVGYIPSWAAKVGNHVQLLTVDEEFWQVVNVGHKTDKDMSRLYKDFQASLRSGGIDQ